MSLSLYSQYLDETPRSRWVGVLTVSVSTLVLAAAFAFVLLAGGLQTQTVSTAAVEAPPVSARATPAVQNVPASASPFSPEQVCSDFVRQTGVTCGLDRVCNIRGVQDTYRLDEVEVDGAVASYVVDFPFNEETHFEYGQLVKVYFRLEHYTDAYGVTVVQKHVVAITGNMPAGTDIPLDLCLPPYRGTV